MIRILGMPYTDATWVLAGVLLLVVEVVALVRGDPPLTASMRDGAERWFLWPALFGSLSGHFFGSRGGPRYGALVLVVLALAVLYRDLFVRDPVPRATHLEVFLVFLGLGAWLWGSR